VPPHDFVRHEDPQFGAAFGGGCGAQPTGVTCGWPELAHRPCCEFHDKDPELMPRCGPDDQGGYCCDNCPTLAAAS
jgi:hypothetical protein